MTSGLSTNECNVIAIAKKSVFICPLECCAPVVCPKLFFCKHLSLVVNKYKLKNYENGHENIFGLLVILELKVENNKILTFNFIFLCQK